MVPSPSALRKPSLPAVSPLAAIPIPLYTVWQSAQAQYGLESTIVREFPVALEARHFLELWPSSLQEAFKEALQWGLSFGLRRKGHSLLCLVIITQRSVARRIFKNWPEGLLCTCAIVFWPIFENCPPLYCSPSRAAFFTVLKGLCLSKATFQVAEKRQENPFLQAEFQPTDLTFQFLIHAAEEDLEVAKIGQVVGPKYVLLLLE